MNKVDLSKIPKLKTNPIFKGLPKALKDPECYETIEKRLISILETTHRHKTISSYVKCSECHTKREERQKVMKEIGFKNLAQYMEWKKIMNIIKNKKNFQIQ